MQDCTPNLRLPVLLGPAGDALERPVHALGESLLEKGLCDVAVWVDDGADKVTVIDGLQYDLHVTLKEARLGEELGLLGEHLVVPVLACAGCLQGEKT